MGKYSDVPSQTPLVRPKSAIYTPKVDATSIPVTFIWEPPPPALLTVLFTGGGSSADPKSVRRCEQLSQRPKQRSRPKTNQYQPDKRQKREKQKKRKKNTKEDFATPIATISPFTSGLKAFLLS